MRKEYLILLNVACLFFSSFLFAGMEYKVKCINPGCDYSSNVLFGGGINMGQITGYCVNCAEFVYLNWKSREISGNGFSDKILPRPEPEAYVCDLSLNEQTAVYKCPKCSKLFIEIKNPTDMKYCPKCNQKSLVVEATGLMYD